jgi:hypothetical protein
LRDADPPTPGDTPCVVQKACGPRTKEKRMKKIVAVGATAALMLMAASPAMAQDAVAVDDSEATGGDVTYLDASQLQFGYQVQYGDADADDDGVATVSSDQWIVQNQANAADGEISDLNQGVDDVGDIF